MKPWSEIRQAHIFQRDAETCAACSQDWPCDAVTVLEALDNALAQVADAEKMARELTKQLLKGKRSDAVEEVLRCAHAWWRSRRPAAWGLDQHLEQPTVHTMTGVEGALADAVADYLRAPRESEEEVC